MYFYAKQLLSNIHLVKLCDMVALWLAPLLHNKKVLSLIPAQATAGTGGLSGSGGLSPGPLCLEFVLPMLTNTKACKKSLYYCPVPDQVRREHLVWSLVAADGPQRKIGMCLKHYVCFLFCFALTSTMGLPQ